VKILDFGLARAVAELTNLTSPGTVVGTPTYMAPEQADGAAVDARSDLFSLGSVLYALAAGAPPFAADSTLGVLRAVCDKAPRPLRELNPAIPQWLADVIAKLHAKNPNDRFQTAAEVADALTRQESQRMPPARRSRRGWRVACAVAASLVLACIGLGLAEATGMTQWRSLLSRSAAAPPPVDGDPAAPLPLAAIAAQDEKKDDKKDDKKPAVVAAALFPFEERGAGVKDLGAKVTDLLFAKLAARPELFLVDRADLKKTLAEQELNLSGAVRADQATKVGQLTGAKLLVSGSVFQVDKKTHVVARVIGTETSRMTAAAVEGKSSDELGPLVDQLADKLAETIAKQTDVLVAKPVLAKDRIAAVKQQLKQAARPSVWVRVTERHVGAAVPDPAAQTEILRFCKETGFEIIDVEEGSKGKADVFITGEGISETAARTGGLISVRARVELKAVDRTSGKVLAADRQTVVVVDLAEQIAGKSALEEAAAILAERILPQLAKR
jgi:TolB-like protein